MKKQIKSATDKLKKGDLVSYNGRVWEVESENPFAYLLTINHPHLQCILEKEKSEAYKARLAQNQNYHKNKSINNLK